MSDRIRIITPLSEETVRGLRAGDRVLLSGTIYSARDRAHQRLQELEERGSDFPFNIKGEVLYYTGPSPARPGRIIGSAGPTTSYRMDPFTSMVLSRGLKGMIGKGRRGPDTREMLRQWRAVYFGTYGGAGAYLSERIVSAQVIAFEELGPEAVFRMEIKDFPLIVINDTFGGDLYEQTTVE
ncbi:MAG: fumarate hydratase C-terminal domain-containing protein [Spirochaetes bacterium]|nr:fumarate hydratase C-terminal domain-containing protein [Spirochaetota bacterium]